MTIPTGATEPATRPGLRERKRRRTFAEIQRVALQLFAEQGYGETTIEQIAEQAEVSPSTVFRYFPTKEDLVLSDEYDPVILSAIAGGPPGEAPVAALRRVFTETVGGLVRADPEAFLTRGRLMLGVPELRAHLWEQLHASETALAQVFATAAGRDAGDFEIRVASAAITGALMAALTDWVAAGGDADMVELLDRALKVLESGLGSVGAADR